MIQLQCNYFWENALNGPCGSRIQSLDKAREQRHYIINVQACPYPVNKIAKLVEKRHVLFQIQLAIWQLKRCPDK